MIRLTLLREKAGLSKAALARRASLDLGLLSKIESGRVMPYLKELHRLAAVLSVPQKKAATLVTEIGSGTGESHDG